MNNTQFDIILFGATSFVGRIVTHHIHQLVNQQSPSLPTGFRWAIAARNESRLVELRTSLGPSAQSLPLIVADSANEAQLLDLCAKTKVIVSTVGPYALFGEALVKACTESGTDYCDLTGEVQWIKRMIDKYEKSAMNSGSHIVHCCGFDSIPSDLGVWFLQQEALKKFGEPCAEIRMGVKAMKGGFSGGTVTSLINVTKEAIANKEIRKQLSDPYLLCPENHKFSARQASDQVAYDADFQSWTAPFVMAGINTRVVHRSNALLNTLYGTDFLYSEHMLLGKNGKWKSRFLGFRLSIFGLLIALGPTRWLLQQFVLPKPGQGPSEEAQKNGLFELIFIGKTQGGEKTQVTVKGKGDPGYLSTSKMLTQAVLCLSSDISQDKPGGFFTPAVLLGDKLIDRLTHFADVTFFRH